MEEKIKEQIEQLRFENRVRAELEKDYTRKYRACKYGSSEFLEAFTRAHVMTYMIEYVGQEIEFLISLL